MNTTFLHTFGDAIREAMALVPLSAVRGLFVALPLVLLAWILVRPVKSAEGDEPPEHPTVSLKIAATFALLLQAVIYAML
ncbi:MAG: hypothetical protein CMJ65_01240 [Planctomycetaceae bacterium]|jgi:hypothetical protein|nr:hypothetical protein [Planctomycetaceae bacterium]MDP7276722.1 hypothetical protein [Planctomycetaceae bacterium]